MLSGGPTSAGVRAMQQDGKLGWGVLGTGRIGRQFASQLPRSSTGVLAAVGSRSLESAKQFAADHGAPNAHDSYQALLDDDTVDAVYIALPHPLHAEWTIRAAQAGKHILCEKPLAVDYAEAMAMVEAARRYDVFLMEAFMYRCHPQTARLRQLVAEGAVGQVAHIVSNFAFAAQTDPASRLFNPELGGGGILDVGCYTASMARLLAGAVAADQVTGQLFTDPIDLRGAGHLGATGVDDWAVASLTFPGGITAQLTTGVGLRVPSEVKVVGSEGYLLVTDPWTPSPDRPASITLARVGQEAMEITVETVPLYAAEADTVAAHLTDRQAPAMSWDDSLGNMATLDRWREVISLSYPSEQLDAAAPTLDRRPLRRRADQTMTYGQVTGIGKQISRLVMGVDNQPHLAHASIMFDDFYERGGNAFDTAYIYGRGRMERLLGQWIRNRGIRQEVVVIAKGAHTPHCDPDSLSAQLLESLDRLQTDYVDLYFMHRDNPDIPVGEFVDVLDEHARAGRIRAFGGSNWSPERFREANAYAAAHDRQPFAALSNHFGLARAYDVPWAGCRHVTDPESRQWLEAEQIPLFPWSSQARGFFTGRARPADRSDEELVRCYYSDENFQRLERARSLAQQLGVAPTAIALAYVLNQRFPTFPLFGPRTLAETRTSMEALAVTLTPEQVAWLDLRL